MWHCLDESIQQKRNNVVGHVPDDVVLLTQKPTAGTNRGHGAGPDLRDGS